MPTASQHGLSSSPGGAGGNHQTSSGSSSPYLPQTEEERTERENQQDIDLHLATTMSRGLDTRSLGRSRSRSGGNDLQIDTDHGDTYRSIRDAQAEQDAHFFDASASPHARQLMTSDRRMHPSPGTAAARFYRQNRRRTLSDTSVDSSAGFIDHRDSQASMPIRSSGRAKQHLSPRDIVKSAAKSKSNRLRAEMSSNSRQEEHDSGDDDDDEEDEEDADDIAASPVQASADRKKTRPRKGTMPSLMSGGQSNSPQISHLTEVMAARGHNSSTFDSAQGVHGRDFDSSNLEEDPIANESMDDEPGVVDHRGQRRPSHSYSRSLQPSLAHGFLRRTRSSKSDDSRHSEEEQRKSDNGEDLDFPPSLSRKPSDVQKVEEDVCYPLLQMREAEMEVIDNRGGDDTHRDAEHAHTNSFSGREGNSMGIPGVLPNFPFPFDFGALEEYCEDEREKQGISIPKSKKGGNVSDATVMGQSLSTARGVSFSPDKTEGGGTGMMRRRMNGEFASRRQRKLSESVGTGHVGRYQRKLALFEEGNTGQRQDDKAGVDVKTPLLSNQTKSRPGFGATAFASHRSTTSASEKARPYRFSFYSNALPTTIHARSLAEIPAENQTFEELFVGRTTTTPPDDWEHSFAAVNEGHAHDAMLPGQRPGVSGNSTPNGGHIPPSVASASYKAGGMNGGGRSSRLEQRPRSNMIRSVEDAEANTWWLDVLCPTDAEMKVLGKVFGIHPLTIEDILMEETREKIELFRNYYLVCFRSFDQDPYSPTYLEPLNMYIIVFREGTLSFHFRGTPHPQNVRRRIKQLKDFINVTSDWISYALIDDITDAFGPLIQNIEYEVDSIDELVLILKDAEQSDMLRRIGTCRKKVMGLLRLMGNKADVVKGLAKRCNENWLVAPKSDIGLYLSDIQDHLITMTQNLNHYEKILSRSHSNYLAQISIEMTDANNQINDVLSKLTALGTVLIPMNLVTGLWGMNVHVPGEGVENLHWFWGIVSCLLGFACFGGWLTYRAFRK